MSYELSAMSLPLSRTYSISEVAELLSVSRQTVFKWLSIGDTDEAVIPPEEWFKLLGGQIRIRERMVLKLMNIGR